MESISGAPLTVHKDTAEITHQLRVHAGVAGQQGDAGLDRQA
jgi:hypothetical protein